MVVIIFLLQDKDFPWKIRVGYAKDIAAGMVSLSSQYSKNKKTFIAKLLSCFGKKLVSPSQAYLHSMNVIHRDLNSYNCLVREVNRCFIAHMSKITVSSIIQLHFKYCFVT